MTTPDTADPAEGAGGRGTLLVVGASRGIGLATTRAALVAGWHVKALARTAETIPDRHPKLEKLDADATCLEVLYRALEGVDAVVQSLGVPFNLKLLTGPIDLFSRSTEVLLDAMSARRCRRLLAVTGFGAGVSKAAIHPLQRLPFKLAFGAAYGDKTRQEDAIKASGLDWTLVRPGVLTDGDARSDYRVLYSPEVWRNGIIARASVADYLVRSINDAATVHAEPVLIG